MLEALDGVAFRGTVAYGYEELDRIEAEERQARDRLEAHRAQVLENEGVAPRDEDQVVLQRLEREWKHALERLHRARKSREKG
jgi:hypothetical protein